MSISYFSEPANGGNGRFIRKTSNGIIFAPAANEIAISGDYADAYYYDGVSVVGRPIMPLSGTHGDFVIVTFTDFFFSVGEVLTINNIPAGALVKYPGGEQIVDDGFVTWGSSVFLGGAKLTITLFPFVDINIRLFIG